MVIAVESTLKGLGKLILNEAAINADLDDCCGCELVVVRYLGGVFLALKAEFLRKERFTEGTPVDLREGRIKAGEVGSSAMPHKVNPIDFENSEGNLGVR